MQATDWRSVIFRSALTGIIAYVVLRFVIPEYTHSNYSSLIAAGVAGAASLLVKGFFPDKPQPKG